VDRRTGTFSDRHPDLPLGRWTHRRPRRTTGSLPNSISRSTKRLETSICFAAWRIRKPCRVFCSNLLLIGDKKRRAIIRDTADSLATAFTPNRLAKCMYPGPSILTIGSEVMMPTTTDEPGIQFPDSVLACLHRRSASFRVHAEFLFPGVEPIPSCDFRYIHAQTDQ
jgi:hypothetical protein